MRHGKAVELSLLESLFWPSAGRALHLVEPQAQLWALCPPVKKRKRGGGGRGGGGKRESGKGGER